MSQAMPKRVRLMLAVLLVLVGGAVAWFYAHRNQSNQTSSLTLYGNVDIREVQPAFNDTGHITRLLMQEGSTVSRGQLLATLDDTRYAAALDQARANMEAARITYHNNETNYRRYESLALKQATSIQQRDDARAAFQAAQASYLAAKAAVALAQREYDDTRLYAPAAGVVEQRILETGDMASPAVPVYTIALLNPKWVRAYVPESDLGRIRLGLAARISTDSYPGQAYKGWIGYISPTAEFTPKTVETPELRTALVYQVRVYVCDGQNALRLGMPATVQIDLARPVSGAMPGCDQADVARQ